MSARALLTFVVLSSLPAAAQLTTPYPGIRLLRSGAAALVVADLCAPGVSVRATRYAERKATPRQWGERADVGVHVAINADFFDFPGWTWVIGRARGAGEDWPASQMLREVRQYWMFGDRVADLQPNAAIVPPAPPAATDIVGSHDLIIFNGQSQAPNFPNDPTILGAHRRTAIGASADRRFLYIFVSDAAITGAQEASQLMGLAAAAGAPPVDVATNEDGGGSSQLYVRGLGQIIDSGRQVNNHLGVYATGSGPARNCPIPPPVRKAALAGSANDGWTLNSHGALVPFGAAPALGPTTERWSFDIGRSFALRPDKRGGYILDGFGGIHPVGTAPPVTGATAYWSGWDIARAIAVNPDGGPSGYVLDGYGGLHAFGGMPAAKGGPYWSGWDIAREVVLRQDGNGGYVLDGLGGLHPFNGAPALAGPRPWPADSARTLLLSFDGQSGYVGDADGNVVPFGRAPTVQVAAFGGGSTGGSALANDGVSGVIVSTLGVRRTFRSAHVARTLLPRDATSGYVLFGDGSLKAFGGAPAATGTPSWPTFDIARGAVLRPDGVSGYILDGYGPLHPFSGAAAAPSGGPSWPGVDIGRDVSAALDGGALYVLDGFGGVHTLGSAPKLTAASYFGGNDVARKLAIRADATGGYYLTATGSLVAIGASPAITGTPAWGGDIARGLWLNSDGVSGYILDGFGGVHRFGGAGRLAGPVDGYARGWDVFRDFKFTSATTAASLDVYGQRHTYILDADAGTTEPPSPDDDAGLPGDDGGSIEPGSDGGDGRLEDGGFLDDGGSDPGLAPGPPPRLTPVGGGCGCGSLPSSAAAWLATFTLACRRRRPREATPTPPDTNRT